MTFSFILMPRQQHSVPIGCFSHELVNAYSEMNSATLLQQWNVKFLTYKCHHHLCIDLLYVLYIHKCILCILDHSVCMCF